MDDDAAIAGAMAHPGPANSGTSNSGPMHREPPPSLGMVAHIWAGHLGPVEHGPVADSGGAADGAMTEQ